MEKKILNTVICYNNLEEVLNYAIKVSKLKKSESLCLVIVINKLDTAGKLKLEQSVKSIKLEIVIYSPDENLGYMNGMLYGYENYIKDYKTAPEYVIMSNTDINYPDENILTKLINNHYNDDIWVIGPSVYVPKRSTYDNPVADYRRSINQVDRLIRIFSTPVINQLYIRASLIKGKISKMTIGEARKVYEVHGCYFIIKSKMAEELIKRPFGAFLYSEETYISEMAYINSKCAYYDTSLLIEHVEHTVTGKVRTKVIAKYLSDSMSVIKKEFYNQ